MSGSMMGRNHHRAGSGERTDASGRALMIGVGGLLALDLVGGLLAVANKLNTPAEAWSSKATLAAPAPMMIPQALLAGAAAHWNGRRGAAAAGLLAVACLVSGTSGFFDGQLGRKDLRPALFGFQVVLIAGTLTVGGLAAARLLRLVRDC
jgi:hypothetical protein